MPPATPAVARVWIAEVPILAWLTIRNMVAKPSMRFSNKGSTASGVTSRPVKPVPPVVMMTSIAGSAIHALTRARISSTSSVTIARVKAWIADPAIDVIITTGGTGFTGRDVTPEAVEPLFEKRMEGFSTMFLMVSRAKIGTSAIQTRATAGVAGGTYIFCLPGSPGACRDAWDEILLHQLDYRYRPCNFVEIMPRLDEHLRRAKAKGATV